jgi:hypothetical protein
MDVLTEEEVAAGATTRALRAPLCAAAGLYALIVVLTAMRHEAWADEAQSWLLSRDASLFELWTRLLRYEGTTGLWQTLLHLLATAGIPYWGMNAFSAMLGLAGIGVLLWRAPFPLTIRLALPFTFYLCYQYAVIARSYDLLPLLLFCAAATYWNASETPWPFTVLLCLLAAVSIHGMILASVAALSVLFSNRDRSRFTLPAACFIGVLALLAASARPASDGTFISGFNLSEEHLVEVSGKAFANAFTGEWISSLLVVLLSVPLLWRGGGLLFFGVSSVLLCAVGAIIYSQVWHHGVLLLAWLFAIWIAWPKSHELGRRLTLASLCVIIAIQGYWTACSVAYDWNHAYSGSLEAARELRQMSLSGKRLYAIGFACIAIEPYFSRNIFDNVNESRPQGYWDWSRRNHVNLDSQRLAELRPDYVIVGYKNEFEHGVWRDLVRGSGYRETRHFEGNSFWQDHVFEPESYDLFARSTAP